MTRDEKLRWMIRRDIESGFMHEMQVYLKKNSYYVKKLAQFPAFIADIIDELVERQMQWYVTASDAAVDAAYLFFNSPAGVEWIQISATFTSQMNEAFKGVPEDIVRRLENLN